MNRTGIIFGFIAVAVIVAAALMLQARVGRDDSAPDLTGQWKSWRSQFRISRQGDQYQIVVDNPGGLLGGTYSGTFRNDAIQVAGPLAPLCREIAWSAETRKLEFCGEEFARAPAPAAH
jgi:hypothetical protein